MKAALWAVAFSRLLDRPLIQSSNSRDLNNRDTRPDSLPVVRSGSNYELSRIRAPRGSTLRERLNRRRGRSDAQPKASVRKHVGSNECSSGAKVKYVTAR
jgi:hypothetical protein